MIEVVDLGGAGGRGPVYGTATEDLNMTLLAWGPGERVAEHVNAERDVVYVITDGSGWLVADGTGYELRAPAAAVVPKGARRELRAGPDGIRYVTVHRARGGLGLGRFAPSS